MFLCVNMDGIVYQINVKSEASGGRGLPKKSVDIVVLTRQGLVGDFNRYRHEECHDDPDKAVLIFPLETIVQLNSEGWPVQLGDIGENFTTQGIPYEYFAIDQRYKVGEVIIQISKVCDPCSNLRHLPYVGQENKARFVKALVGRRGWYARVLKGGEVKVKESIQQLTD